MTGTRYGAGAQDLDTSAEQIIFPADMASIGLGFIRNAGAAPIQIGVVVAASFYPVLALEPGEAYVVRLGDATLYALADTGGSSLDFQVLEA